MEVAILIGFPPGFVWFLGPALALGANAPVEKQQIYECTDVQGNVVYQDEPCIEAVPAPAPKPRSKVATKAAPKTAGKTWVLVPQTARRVEPPGDRGRFAGPSPETTLRTFVGAIEAGDRALVVSCLTAAAAARLAPDASSFPLEELRATVAAFTAFVTEGAVGPYWSIRALRRGARPKWILFERTPRGEWKISGI